MTSSRPYLLRALYEWIADNNCTPYVIVNANVPDVSVPEQFIQDGKIILNISAAATNKLLINNDAVEFDARFSGKIRHIYAPISSVLAIYARENGRGMVFEDEISTEDSGGEHPFTPPPTSPSPTKPSNGKPQLKIVK